VEFLLDDRPATETRIPASVAKMIKVIDSLDEGKLVSQRKLADLCGLMSSTLAKWAQYPEIVQRKVRIMSERNRNYYGNLTTIAAYKEAHNVG